MGLTARLLERRALLVHPSAEMVVSKQQATGGRKHQAVCLARVVVPAERRKHQVRGTSRTPSARSPTAIGRCHLWERERDPPPRSRVSGGRRSPGSMPLGCLDRGWPRSTGWAAPEASTSSRRSTAGSRVSHDRGSRATRTCAWESCVAMAWVLPPVLGRPLSGFGLQWPALPRQVRHRKSPKPVHVRWESVGYFEPVH
jgi:hypothetical protein